MSAPLNILQVCSAESLGGGERHVIDLTRALVERGHRLHLAVRPQSPLRKPLANMPVQWHELGLRNAIDLLSARQLAGIIGREKIDVLHAHVARDYTFCGLAARMARPVRYYLTRHHFNPIKSNAIYEWALAEARALIAVSESVRAQLAAAFPKLSDRIMVIPNWVIPNWIDNRLRALSREEARARLGIRRPLAAGIIGQITPLKRQHLFIRAAGNLIKEKKLTDAEFLIIGEPGPADEDYAKHLRELVEQMDIEEYVRFTGYIDGLAPSLRGLDVVAVVSQNEGFSLALVEAMAAGCAVVATNAGGMAEIVKDGVTGILIEPDDDEALIERLAELLSDKLRREELGKAAQTDVISRFDREKVIDRIERLYMGFTTKNT